VVTIPSSLLRETITLEPFEGSGAYGPIYGAQQTLRARVEGKRRVVRKEDGTDLISSATAFVRPGVDIATESRVTHLRHGASEPTVYEVVDVLPGEGLSRPAYLELLLS
jgi:hypothetical protein